MLSATVITGLVLSLSGAPEQVSKNELQPAKTKTHRSPVKDTAQVRSTEMKFRKYHDSLTVVRTRSAKKRFATFSTDPLLLSSDAAVVFEIYSVAESGVVPRWRCVATEDVADCLGTKVRVRYLPKDEQIVLRATLVPESEVPEFDEALASR